MRTEVSLYRVLCSGGFRAETAQPKFMYLLGTYCVPSSVPHTRKPKRIADMPTSRKRAFTRRRDGDVKRRGAMTGLVSTWLPRSLGKVKETRVGVWAVSSHNGVTLGKLILLHLHFSHL